jgi:hypothetical protein
LLEFSRNDVIEHVDDDGNDDDPQRRRRIAVIILLVSVLGSEMCYFKTEVTYFKIT